MSATAVASKRVLDRRERLIALLLVAVGSLGIFIPLAYLVGGSLASKETIKTQPKAVIPTEAMRVTIEGQDCFVYDIEIKGVPRRMAVVEKKGGTWVYANPDKPSERYEADAAGPERRATRTALHPENFGAALAKSPFGRYILNTLVIMLFATIGTVASSVLVAYGFARFRLKGMPILFMILLSTIMLPSQITLIPTFVVFKWLGWYDTFLPLIVPAFFANAWDVFLFRQFFMGIPKELDEAATIDGCGPLRVLGHVILPQSVPVIVTVTLSTAIYTWNDFFSPLVYLQSPDRYTVAVGLQNFSALYFNQAHLQAAGALMMLLPPVIVFFFAQRYFIQGTVVSGVKG
jgi:multiple sugar transport system permease protein